MPGLRFVCKRLYWRAELIGSQSWSLCRRGPVVRQLESASDLLRGFQKISLIDATLAIVSNGSNVYHPTATGRLSGEG